MGVIQKLLVSLQLQDDLASGISSAISNAEGAGSGAGEAFTKKFKAGLVIGGAVTEGASLIAEATIDKNEQYMGQIEQISHETGIGSDQLAQYGMQLSNAKDKVSDVSNVMDILGKSGVNTADSMNADAQAALTLMNATNATPDSISKVVSSLKAYGLGADDVKSKSGELTAINHSTQYSLDDTANIMARAANNGKLMGMSYDQVAQVVEILGQRGVPARQATADIDAAMKATTKSSADLQKKYDSLTDSQTKLGQTMGDDKTKLSILQSEHGKTGSAAASHALEISKLQQKIQDEQGKFDENTTTLQSYQTEMQNGTNSMDGFYAALGITNDQVANASTKLTGAAGDTQKYSDIVVEHQGFVASLGNTLDKLGIQAGQALQPFSPLIGTVSVLSGAVTAAGTAMEVYDAAQKLFAGSAAAATTAQEIQGAAIGTASMEAEVAAVGMDTMAVSEDAAAASAGAMDLALSPVLVPIVAIIAAVALVAAGIYLLDQRFHFIQPTIDTISRGFGIMGDLLGKDLSEGIQLGGAALNWIVGILQGLWDITKKIIDKGSELANALNPVSALSGAASGIGSYLPHFASGGQIDGPAIVGERGEELWVPPVSGGTIIPNDQLSGAGSGSKGGGDTYNITMNIGSLSRDYTAADAMKDLDSTMRQKRTQRGIPTL